MKQVECDSIFVRVFFFMQFFFGSVMEMPLEVIEVVGRLGKKCNCPRLGTMTNVLLRWLNQCKEKKGRKKSEDPFLVAEIQE